MAKRGKGKEKSSAPEDQTETQTPAPIPDITRTFPTEAAIPQRSADKSPGKLTVPGRLSRGLSSSKRATPSDEDLIPKPLNFGGPKTPPPTPSKEDFTPKPLKFGTKKPSPIKQTETRILAAARLRGGMESKDSSQGPSPFEDLTPGLKPPPGGPPGKEGRGPDDDDDEWIYETDSDYEVENVPGSKSGWEKPQKPIDHDVRGDVMGLIGEKEAPIPPHLMGKSSSKFPPPGSPPGSPPGQEGSSSGSNSESDHGAGGGSVIEFEKGGVSLVEPTGKTLTLGAEDDPKVPIPPRTPPDERSHGPPPRSPPPEDPPFDDLTPGYKPPPGSPPHSPPGSPGGGSGSGGGSPIDYSKLFIPAPTDEFMKQFVPLETGCILGKDDNKSRTPIDQMAAKQELLAKLAADAAAKGGKPDSKVLVGQMKQLPQSVRDFRKAARGKTAPPYPEALAALEDALVIGTDAAGQTLKTAVELQKARLDLAASLAQIAGFDHDGAIARLTKDLDDLKKSTKDKTMSKGECDAHLAEQTQTLQDQLDVAERGSEHLRVTANEKIDELTAERDQLKNNNEKLKKELDDLRKPTKGKTLTLAECDAQHEEETNLLRLEIQSLEEAAKWDLKRHQKAIHVLTEEKAKTFKAWSNLVQQNADFSKNNQESVGGVEPGVKSPQAIHDALKKKHDDLKTQNNALQKDHDDLVTLNGRIAELERELGDAKSNNSEDQTTKVECDERVKKETKHLQDEIKRLQKQLADIKATLTLFHTTLNWDITKIGLTEDEAKVFGNSLNDSSWTQDNIDTWLRAVADEAERLRRLIVSHEVKIQGLEEAMHNMITQDDCDAQSQSLQDQLDAAKAALTSFHGLLNWQNSDLDSDGEEATDFENILNADGWTQDNIEQLLDLVTRHIRRLQDESTHQDAEIHRLQDEVNARLTQELCDAQNQLTITQKEAKIAKLQVAQAAHDAEIDQHKRDISEKIRQIQDLDQHIEDMLTEEDCATKNAAAIAQKNQQIKDLEAAKAKLEKQINALNDAATNLITEADCTARNDNALADKDQTIADLQAANQKLRSDAPPAGWVTQEAHTEGINALNVRIADLEQKLTAADAETARIGGVLAARNIQTASSLTQAQIDRKDADITRLKATIAQNEEDCDKEKKRLKKEIKRLEKEIRANKATCDAEKNALQDAIDANEAACDAEKQKLKGKIRDLEKKLDDAEEEIRLLNTKAPDEILMTGDPSEAQSQLTQYLKDQVSAEIARLNNKIIANQAACDAEKKDLQDKMDANDAAHASETAAFARNIATLRDRVRDLEGQVNENTDAVIKGKDDEIKRLKAQIIAHEHTILDLKIVRNDLSAAVDAQRLNLVAVHQTRGLRARIMALENQIRNLTGKEPPPPPHSPTGSDDSSSSTPLDEKYTPTADTNDLQILRIDIAMLCMVHRRAFFGFVQGDTDIAMKAANDAARDAQRFRNSLPQNAPDRDEAFGRALYWQGLVAYYDDNLGDATTYFAQSDSLAWTHADRSNLQGWIDRCENGISVDRRKEAYTPKPRV